MEKTINKEHLKEVVRQLLRESIVKTPFELHLSYGVVQDVEQHFAWTKFQEKLIEYLHKYKCELGVPKVEEEEKMEKWEIPVICEDKKYRIYITLQWKPSEVWDGVLVKKYYKLYNLEVDVEEK